MNRISMLRSAILLSALASVSHAGSTPKFSVIPLVSPVVTIGEHTLQAIPYRITNNTKTTRTLTFEPVNGIIQNSLPSFAPNTCASPFTLAYGQSCVLLLIATDANAHTGQSTGGPVVCKTFGDGNNKPNPFLCSQPVNGDQLRINVVQPTGGTAYCWGQNNYGELGQPANTTPNPLAQPVQDLSANVLQLTLGESHACALMNNGGVKCWGNNAFGQLGNRTNVGSYSSTPLDVIGLPLPAIAITAGSNHSCAILLDGKTYCWGGNSYCQLGRGFCSNGALTVPEPIINQQGKAIKVNANLYGACALLASGEVQCWGANTYGEVGVPAVPNQYIATPTIVAGISSKAVNISGGAYHNCVLLSTGGMMCWGHNNFGQLGNPTALGSYSYTPLTVQDLDGTVIAISGSGDSTCSLMYDRTAKCWGHNRYGELGNATNAGTNNPNVTPLPVTGVSDILQLTTMSCALLSTHGAQCWGHNNFGQLGNPTNSGTNATNVNPLDVTGLTSGVKRIAQHNTNGAFGCAIVE